MSKLLGVLTAEDLQKAAAAKIDAMTPEEAQAHLDAQAAEESVVDPAKVAADNETLGRFAHLGVTEVVKRAGELLESGMELPDVLVQLREERNKFAAEIDAIPDDEEALELAEKIEQMASDPRGAEAINSAYDAYVASQAEGAGEAA